MQGVNVKSEIGNLKKVILHRLIIRADSYRLLH